MPLTDQDIRALVHLAVACRPLGAPRWDEAGIFAAIAKVRTLAIDDVCVRARPEPPATLHPLRPLVVLLGLQQA
jgi:hypothetical protein